MNQLLSNKNSQTTTTKQTIEMVMYIHSTNNKKTPWNSTLAFSRWCSDHWTTTTFSYCCWVTAVW